MNKTGTSNVGDVSKAQKAQKTFFEKKKLEIFEIFSFRKCRIVPKNVKEGTLWALLTYSVAKYQKSRKWGPFGDIKKISKKSRTMPKKIERGDPLV